MSGVTISSAVRTNLLSLQNISSQQSAVQNRLATGKKVNSALDNATSFFTASSFSSRASSLSSLLDSVSTGVQTLQAANNGITSITSLVNQLRSTAQQALQSTSAYSAQAKVSSTTAISGATSADLRGVGAASAGSATATNALSSLTSGTRASSTSSSSFASSVHGASQAAATSTSDFSTLADTVAATETGTATDLSGLTSGTSTLSISDGSTGTGTLTYDTAATAGDLTKFASVTDLNTKLSTIGVKATVGFTGAGSAIKVTATDTSVGTLTVGGTGRTALGLATTATRTDGGSIRVRDSSGNGVTLFKDTSGSRANSFTNATTLSAALATAGVNATATLGGAGGTKLVVTGTNANDLTIDNGTNGSAVLGFTATSNAYTHTAASTLTIGDGANSQTFTYNSAATAGDATQFNSIGDLNTKLTGANIKVSATNASGNLKLTATDYASTLSVGGNAQAGLGLATSTAGVAGSALTVSDGTNTKTYTYDTAATSSDAKSFASISDLNTKLGTDSVKATATTSGGNLKLSAGTTTTTLAVSGTAQSGLGLAASVAPTTAPGALDGKTLSFTTSGGNATTVTFGDPAVTTGAIKSLDDLNTKLAGVGLSAALDSTGNLAFTTTSQTASQTFTIGGSATGTGESFTTTGSTTATRGGSGADTRDSLVTQFNGLLNQIDTVAKDSNFNGLNLLNGDTLSLIFNEKNTSKLDVNGTSANSTGLGLSNVTASDFNDGNGINSVLSLVDKAKTSLSTQAGKFGSNLAVVQTRQDFTKNTINTLNTGADNLVNADLNEEATNLLSLNTSQSLAQQALSLANSSQQSVLQLLR